MDLGNLQGGGDVLELLALFACDAIVGKEGEIGSPDHLFLGGLVEHSSRCGDLRECVASRGGPRRRA